MPEGSNGARVNLKLQAFSGHQQLCFNNVFTTLADETRLLNRGVFSALEEKKVRARKLGGNLDEQECSSSSSEWLLESAPVKERQEH